MGFAGIVAAVGAAGSAYGAYSSGKATEDAAKRQASYDRVAAAKEAADRARDAKKLAADQRVMYLKSGVRLEGTPLLVMEQSKQEAQSDIDYLTWTAGKQNQETLSGGKASGTAGKIGAGGSILQGISGAVK